MPTDFIPSILFNFYFIPLIQCLLLGSSWVESSIIQFLPSTLTFVYSSLQVVRPLQVGSRGLLFSSEMAPVYQGNSPTDLPCIEGNWCFFEQTAHPILASQLFFFLMLSALCPTEWTFVNHLFSSWARDLHLFCFLLPVQVLSTRCKPDVIRSIYQYIAIKSKVTLQNIEISLRSRTQNLQQMVSSFSCIWLTTRTWLFCVVFNYLPTPLHEYLHIFSTLRMEA